MRYCTRCLYPDTKPHLSFNADGVCSACTAFEARKTIDWGQRERQFRDIAREALARSAVTRQPYDCIVPVSGGKDSHYQVLKCLAYGLQPLAVTAMTDHLTDIGWRNLNNISKLGVDHVMVQVDQELRRRINKYALQTVGDISWPEHVLIFAVPVREALLRGIPLIVYGECPENEYGGPEAAQTATKMDRRWLEEFGGLNGLRVSDLVDMGIATEAQMEQYTFPESARIEEFGLESLFLGQFFEWDGYHNAYTAQEHGFETSDHRLAGGLYSYENLDNAQTGIHDRFKFIKFGFGRTTDHVNSAIRRGRMAREQGIRKVREYDGEFPSSYLQVPLERILHSIDMTRNEYTDCEMKFINRELFNVIDERIGLFEPKFKVGVST